jgi:hypothetical protein
MGRIRFLASLILLSIATQAQLGTPGSAKTPSPDQQNKASARQGSVSQSANVLPSHPHDPISLVILHEKHYPFSRHLFDGSVANGRMQLTAKITNISTNPVTVSTYAPAVIIVKAITYRHWGPIMGTEYLLRPLDVVALFQDDPRSIASQALVTLAPGQDVQFPITKIRMIDLRTDREIIESLYTPPGCGTYNLVFQYFYVGPDGTFQNVYHFAVTAAPIKVEIGSAEDKICG